MTESSSQQLRWREIFERQQLANAKRWLDLLEQEDNPTDIVIEEYDNLLRTLEISLQKSETFDLASRLIDQLFPIVFGYGDWDRWLVYLGEAIDLSQRLHLESEQANFLSRMGDIWTLKGDYQQAFNLYSQSMIKYDELDDSANYARTLTKIAAVHDFRGNTKESLSLLEEALRVSNLIGDLRVLMEVNLSLSSAYHKSREWLPGLSSAQTAYELAKELGDSHTEMRALLNIVAVHTELGDWAEVEKLSPKIEETLTASGDLIKLSQLKNNMGIAAFNQGHYYLAEKAWQDSLRINSQINHLAEIARIYNNLGMVYTKLGELDAAEGMLEEASSIFQQKGDLFNWANTLDNLADIYDIRGDVVKFRDTLNFALSLLPVNSTESHIQGLVSIINGRLASSSV